MQTPDDGRQRRYGKVRKASLMTGGGAAKGKQTYSCVLVFVDVDLAKRHRIFVLVRHLLVDGFDHFAAEHRARLLLLL